MVSVLRKYCKLTPVKHAITHHHWLSLKIRRMYEYLSSIIGRFSWTSHKWRLWPRHQPKSATRHLRKQYAPLLWRIPKDLLYILKSAWSITCQRLNLVLYFHLFYWSIIKMGGVVSWARVLVFSVIYLFCKVLQAAQPARPGDAI